MGLPAELERVDALLDDPAFFTPFAAHFDPVMGRPSIPIETYLRMMFLKFRYQLGFETLCREVTDSISWRRFCRIPQDSTPTVPVDVDRHRYVTRPHRLFLPVEHQGRLVVMAMVVFDGS